MQLALKRVFIQTCFIPSNIGVNKGVKWDVKMQKWKGFRLSPSGYWNDLKKTKVCLRVTTYNMWQKYDKENVTRSKPIKDIALLNNFSAPSVKVFEIWLRLSIRKVTVQYLRSDFVQWNISFKDSKGDWLKENEPSGDELDVTYTSKLERATVTTE